MMNRIIIAHIIIKRKLDINSNEKPNKKKKKKQLFHRPSLSEMVGGLLPKRHIHSFKQSTNFFAPLAQHRLTVLHKFMHFQGRGGRKINIISQWIHISQRQQRLHRAGLNSAAGWSGTRATLSPRSRCWLAHLCISLSWWRGKKSARFSSSALYVVWKLWARARY